MENSNNNETYKLLDLSEHSESDLELPELVSAQRKKKVRRKVRKLRQNSIHHIQPICSCNARIISMGIVGFLLISWIITLTWLAIVLHSEIQRLDSAVIRVVASSQEGPTEIQKLFTKSKSLQENQTIISSRIDSLRLQLENFTKDVSYVQTNLAKIQEKLHSIPDHVNVPQQLQDVSASIANLGSQIKDITTTVASLKSSKEDLEKSNSALVQNVTSLRQSVKTLQNVTQVPAVKNSENDIEIHKMLELIDGIKNNISTINTTLSNNILWVRDDLKKNNKNIESISNVGQNMSARVTTLEGICGKTSSDQITLSTSVKGLTEQFESLSMGVQNHSIQINELQSKIYQLNQNSSEMAAAINTLTNSFHMFAAPEVNSARSKTDESPSSTVEQEAVTPTSGASADNKPVKKPSVTL